MTTVMAPRELRSRTITQLPSNTSPMTPKVGSKGYPRHSPHSGTGSNASGDASQSNTENIDPNLLETPSAPLKGKGGSWKQLKARAENEDALRIVKARPSLSLACFPDKAPWQIPPLRVRLNVRFPKIDRCWPP